MVFIPLLHEGWQKKWILCEHPVQPLLYLSISKPYQAECHVRKFLSKNLKKYDLTRPKVSKYSLTSWPEVIIVFHGEYKRTFTDTLNLSHYARRSPWTTTSRCRGFTSVRGKSTAHNSLELTTIATGTLVSSVPSEGSHSWNVSPDKSSTTRCNHNSTTRELSPSEYLVPLYWSHLHFRPCNSNFLSTQSSWYQETSRDCRSKSV